MTPLSARPYAYWHKGAQAPGVWGEKEEEEDNSKGEEMREDLILSRRGKIQNSIGS